MRTPRVHGSRWRLAAAVHSALAGLGIGRAARQWLRAGGWVLGGR